MSYLIFARPDGSRSTIDQGPAHASMSVSRGGLTLGQALSMVTVAHKGNHGEPKLRGEAIAPTPERWYSEAPRCDMPTSNGTCARAYGHKEGTEHRTRAQMDAGNAQRLITRVPLGGRR